jgi:hypothetical protein
MPTPKYAYLCPRLDGEPWLDIDDARLIDDWLFGCDFFTLALRAKRSEDEVKARLLHLGCDLDRPRRLRARDRVIGH